MRDYNNVDVRGRLFSHTLAYRDTVKGEAISGSISIEVNSKGDTVDAQFFAYPNYSTGRINRTYTVLEGILNGDYKTVDADGDDASWLSFTGNVDISYFASNNNEDEAARSQRIRGSFINQNKKHEYFNKWKTDMFITKIVEMDRDDNRNIDRYLRVSGYIIDSYRKTLKEVVFDACSEAAINYISSLAASEETPYAVSMWGEIGNLVVEVKKKNAFGEDEVAKYVSRRWVITGMSPDSYDFGDESVITKENWDAFKENLRNLKNDTVNGSSNKGTAARPKLSF